MEHELPGFGAAGEHLRVVLHLAVAGLLHVVALIQAKAGRQHRAPDRAPLNIFRPRSAIRPR